MPLRYGFGLENSRDLPELPGRAVLMSLELGDQNSLNQFFGASGLDRVLLFASQDIELVAEDQDLQVLICCRSATETDKVQ